MPINYELRCYSCNYMYDKNQLNSFCTQCGKSPITVHFDLTPSTAKNSILSNVRSMWRYGNFLPLLDENNRITLGEGWTPILHLSRLAERLELNELIIKDESFNPTGSFKARGLSMAISKAKELNVDACIVPTAGNAGGALSAYCAKAAIKSIVVMPRHTPEAFKKECKAFGAELILVDGLINDCAKVVAELKKDNGYFDISTMKEPYRLEGKKTLGYEIAEQLDWKLPDVILYPAGGGTGLIGIWKAFKEMQSMGWIKDVQTKMIAVQADNCKPLVDTFNGLQLNSSGYQGSPTIANGLAVPHPFAEKMMLDVLKQSKGLAISVSEKEIVTSVKEIAALEGMLVAPEGAALLAALKQLLKNGEVRRDEKILLLNTGSCYKYLDSFEF
ncbi:threonine synthase [Pedobacter frigiditerrae]|uniref:Threonine synthase n=1 Tax=Pedobacter frigiditerrae TaxID=2530452 RepID=A0A4R0MXN6_9SPHI|nr:threonine synthase [Pedobacter frigiditerrae]TCC92048.1 threonine synthase [Pedobacter frigiditerrae]